MSKQATASILLGSLVVMLLFMWLTGLFHHPVPERWLHEAPFTWF